MDTRGALGGAHNGGGQGGRPQYSGWGGEKLGVAAVMELKTAGEEVSRTEQRSRSGWVEFLDHLCAVRPDLYGIGRERSIREDSSISCISPLLLVEHHIIADLLENTESFFSVFGYPQHVFASGIA
jgi:hypothetical protein